MQFSEAFKTIMKSRGYTQMGLAEEIGVKQAAVSSVVTKNNPSIDVAHRYLSRLGYEVALVPVGSKLPEGSYVLEQSGKGRE